MAVTVPTPAQERVDRLARMWAERPGVLGWLTTTDHKRVGLLYFWTTLALFGAGGVEALLMRTQLNRANERFLSPNAYDQLFSVHGITMIFFFIIPMTTGAFGNYLIPLMIGAPDMSFNRMPLFCFAFLAAAFGLLFALPALSADTIFLFLDRRVGTHFFDVAHGGSALLWQHLFWIFGHPEVYILIVPAFGIATSIIP